MLEGGGSIFHFISEAQLFVDLLSVGLLNNSSIIASPVNINCSEIAFPRCGLPVFNAEAKALGKSRLEQ